MLRNDLTTQVIAELTYWEANYQRDGIRQKFADMLNPGTFDTFLLQAMFTRTQNFQGHIRNAKTNGEINSLIMPLPAAMAFEAVFHTIATYWLAAGDPTPPDVIRQSVLDFIDTQVDCFASFLGA